MSKSIQNWKNAFNNAGTLAGNIRAAYNDMATADDFDAELDSTIELLTAYVIEQTTETGEKVDARVAVMKTTSHRVADALVESGTLKAKFVIGWDDKKNQIKFTFPKSRNTGSKKSKNRFLELAGKINAGSVTLDEYAEFMSLVAEKKPS